MKFKNVLRIFSLITMSNLKGKGCYQNKMESLLIYSFVKSMNNEWK